MTVHQVWRFPRNDDDLSMYMPTSGLQQLNSEELAHVRDIIWLYHTHPNTQDKCCSIVVQRIRAPVDVVWSVVRRFDNPQAYKRFIRSCSMRGDGQVGSTREVRLISGVPADSSTERLEILDEERHVLSFKIVGGRHRLRNYHSVTTLQEADANTATIVVESYVVDVPEGNTTDDTQTFADTIVKYNLQSLARLSEHQVRRQQGRNHLLLHDTHRRE